MIFLFQPADNNFTSFQRQLNLYGFRRSASYDKGAYYHPQFQQGQRELAESIRRVLAPSNSSSSQYPHFHHGQHQQQQDQLAAAYGALGMAGMAGMGGFGMGGMQMHPMMSYMSAMSGLGGMPMMNMQNMQNMQNMMNMPMNMPHPGAAPPSGSSADPSSGGDGAEAGGANVDSAADSSQTSADADNASASSSATAAAGAGAGAGGSGSNPTPLPLPQWVQPSAQSYYANLLNAGAAQGGNFWQNLALSGGLANMGGNLGKMNNPYMIAQNPYLGQFPFPPYGMEGSQQGMAAGGGGAGGGGDAGANAYNYNGTYNIMSQLRNFHPVTGKPIVPPRGYNRNSTKRHRDGTEDGHGRKKLSARDRKLHDMHTVGEGYNAEQFLAGTTRSDRYSLGGKSSLLSGARGHRRRIDGEGDGGEAGLRGRGRPKGSCGKRGDEASYQDGEDGVEGGRRKHRHKSKRSKHSRGYDSESSTGSIDGAPAKTKRIAGAVGGNRSSSSYRNLPADVLSKSGLSRNSAITHLTENAEEDLIDLRNPQKRRIFLDFTVNGTRDDADASVGDAGTDGADDNNSDYVCGFYRGALTQGKSDMNLHSVIHGSHTLAETLLRLNNSVSDSPSPLPSAAAASMITTQNKDNAPRSTRIGDDFQCDIPALQPPPNPAATATVTRRTAAITSVEGLIWRPNVLSTECVDTFVALLRERKKLIPLPVGSVLVVHLAAENAYRLCCVLDVIFADPAVVAAGEGAGVTSATRPAPGTTMVDASVRVFDGYEVPICVSFQYSYLSSFNLCLQTTSCFICNPDTQ